LIIEVEGRLEQFAGVGVLRIVEDIAAAPFDNAAVEHYRDFVGKGLDYPEVMGDKQIGHVEALLQILEQFDNLGLNGHVEGAGWFIEDQQPGMQDNRPGDGDPLALSAGKFMGIAIEHFLGQADFDQCLNNQAAPLFPVTADPVDFKSFADDLFDGQSRGQGRKGILENHLDILPQRAHPPVIEFHEIMPVESYHPPAAGQSEQTHAQRAFTGTGLPDDAEGLALADSQIDAVHRLYGAHGALEETPLDREMAFQGLRLPPAGRFPAWNQGGRCYLFIY